MNLLQTIQSIVQNCMKSADLTDLVYGTIASVNPLSVELNNPSRLIIPAAALELTYSVSDHYVDMTVDHMTDDAELENIDVPMDLSHAHSVPGYNTGDTAIGGDSTSLHNHTAGGVGTSTENPGANGMNIDASQTEHAHPYTGRKMFLVHYGLAVGERVMMLKTLAGQKYIILSRVVTGSDYAGNPT